ncbi:unnamed protein product [Hanseniaspora opuntiae]
MSDTTNGEDHSQLHHFLTSYFQIDSINKINYHQYIGSEGNEQWCFCSDLYMRSRDGKALVSLFGKELWCFSLNDDPVPVPFERKSPNSAKNSISGIKSPLMDDDMDNLNHLSNDNNKFSISADANSDYLQNIDLDVIDPSLIQERLPDKTGHFNANFAKPNLPTSYAIFLKAVRRLIYLNLSADSFNKFIPFGNSCLIQNNDLNQQYKNSFITNTADSNDFYRVLNISPHLFENGCLSVSINYKNLALTSFKKLIQSTNSSESGLSKCDMKQYAVYLAPSGVRCFLSFSSDDLSSCISKTPPKNATKILKILKISHGIDLLQDQITWIKVFPSILHLSGQTPSIYNYLKDFEHDVNDPEQKKNLILWPLELLFLQKYSENTWGIDAPQSDIDINLESALQKTEEINELNLKLKLKYGDSNDALNDEPMYMDNNGIPTNLPLIQHSSPFLMLQQGSPDKMMPPSSGINNDINNNINNKYLLSVGNTNQMTGPDGVSVNIPSSHGLIKPSSLINNRASNTASPFFKIKSNDTSPQFGGLEKDLFENSNIENDDIKESPDLGEEEALNDEMKDLFGDDDDDDDDESVKEESEEKTIGKKRPFKLIDDSYDTPKSSGYTYSDPGAPVANSITPAFQENSQNPSISGNNIHSMSENTSTIKDRRSSVYSHINFNPLINNVDSKYKLGGKFAMGFQKSNVPDDVFTENIDEPHGNDSLIKQENCNNNTSTKDNINLQEIMYQASRGITSGGFNYDDDMYENEVSSDEDDNGMISIKDITNTNISVPLTSITHASNKNNLSVNNVDNYPSLPYSNIFSTNNMNTIKESSFFPLSVLNEINPPITHPSGNKPINRGYSVNTSQLVANVSKNPPYKNDRENQLLMGNEFYKSQSPTSLVSPGFIASGNQLDNLMLVAGSNKPSSPENILDIAKVKENFTAADSPVPEIVDKKVEVDDEVKAINVLPFVLRHMPIFSIPFQFYKSFEINHFTMNVDKELFLHAYEREVIFNNFIAEFIEKKDILFGSDNIFYNEIDEVKDIFLRMFPKFKRLSLGTDMLSVDKPIEEVFKENHCSTNDKLVVMNDFDDNEVGITAKDLNKWYNFDLKPLGKHDKNMDLNCCFITDTAFKCSSEFMNKFSLNYNKRKFGNVKFITELMEKGVLPVDQYDYKHAKYCSVKILKDFVGITKCTDLIIFLPLDVRKENMKADSMKKFAFYVNLKKILLNQIPPTLLKINLHFVPNSKLDFTTLLEMNKICLSVFNKISISDATNKIGTRFLSKLDKSNENTRTLKDDILMNNYNVPIITAGNVPYFNVCKNNNFDNYIIVCYSRSIDKNYLTASWVLPDGTNFHFKTWRLGDSTKFEKVCDEIWRRTMAIITTQFGIHKVGGYKLGDSNCIILTRLNSILPDDELVHWRRLSSKNKNVSLAVVCADFNINHSNQNTNKDVHFTYLKNSLPLSNSQHRCSIKTGAIININSALEEKNVNFCDYLEINLLNCPHSSASVLLDRVMWNMYSLSLLNPNFGITQQTVVPFNILIIERVLRSVVHMDL